MCCCVGLCVCVCCLAPGGRPNYGASLGPIQPPAAASAPKAAAAAAPKAAPAGKGWVASLAALPQWLQPLLPLALSLPLDCCANIGRAQTLAGRHADSVNLLASLPLSCVAVPLLPTATPPPARPRLQPQQQPLLPTTASSRSAARRTGGRREQSVRADTAVAAGVCLHGSSRRMQCLQQHAWDSARCGCLWRSSSSSITCHTLMAGRSVMGSGLRTVSGCFVCACHGRHEC